MYYAKELIFFGNHSVTKYDKLAKSKIDFYHLTFVLKGEVTYIADGTTYTLRENDALFLKKGTIRERLKSNSPAQYVIFNFQINEGMEPELDIFMKGIVNRNIKRILHTYPYAYYSDNSVPLTAEKDKVGKIMQNLLNCIIIEILDSSKSNLNNPHVVKAIKYINDSIMSPITLKDVGKAIHLSKEYTAKIFKENTGKTVTEYINEQKMFIARDMLNTKEMSIKNIANNLGYENYSYFSRLFKKQFNISPSKIKN